MNVARKFAVTDGRVEPQCKVVAAKYFDAINTVRFGAFFPCGRSVFSRWCAAHAQVAAGTTASRSESLGWRRRTVLCRFLKRHGRRKKSIGHVSNCFLHQPVRMFVPAHTCCVFVFATNHHRNWEKKIRTRRISYVKLETQVGVAREEHVCARSVAHGMGRFTAVESSVRALAPLLSEARRQRIADVVESRSGYLAVLLENAWDEGNRNAVLRSMDAFGVHTLHCLNYGKENKGIRRTSGGSEMRTDAGARSWIVRRDWTCVDECIRQLRREGFAIASAAPNANRTLQDVDFSSKRLVIAFGNEHIGVSDSLLEASEIKFSIPMVGFVQSFNLSVSVAVALYQAFSQRLARSVSDEAIRPGAHSLLRITMSEAKQLYSKRGFYQNFQFPFARINYELGNCYTLTFH